LSERFFSAENARSSTGLGLSAAKTLTRQMNGAIAAEYSGGVLCVRPAFPEAAGNRRGGQQRADKKWGRWQTKPPLANKAAAGKQSRKGAFICGQYHSKRTEKRASCYSVKLRQGAIHSYARIL